jgi:hypothetical protein
MLYILLDGRRRREGKEKREREKWLCCRLQLLDAIES